MTPDQIAAYVDAASGALALPLAAAHRPGVLHYFALAASLADLVNAHPLQLSDEQAGLFTPVSPPAARSPTADADTP